jgi:hypothetical protein
MDFRTLLFEKNKGQKISEFSKKSSQVFTCNTGNTEITTFFKEQPKISTKPILIYE